METHMDIEELKLAWQKLETQMQQQNDRHSALLRDNRVQQLRTGMLPLALSYFATMLLGMLGIFIISLDKPSTPVTDVVWYCGMLSGSYCVSVVALAFVALLRYGQIDYAAPVVRIQEQLARLHKAHVQCGMFASASWLLLWLPFAVVIFFNFTGVDLTEHMPPAFLIANIIVGAIGVGIAWRMYRWAMRSPGAPLATRIRDALTGATLRRAQAEVDALKRFAQD
jgi:hypothetical protein